MLQQIIQERGKYIFDPLIHTKDGKTWIEENQAKRYSLQTSILLIESLIKKCEEMGVKGISIIEKEGSEYTTPKMYRAMGYDRAVKDLKSYLQSQLQLIKKE